jgi:hypothetical protein
VLRLKRCKGARFGRPPKDRRQAVSNDLDAAKPNNTQPPDPLAGGKDKARSPMRVPQGLAIGLGFGCVLWLALCIAAYFLI